MNNILIRMNVFNFLKGLSAISVFLLHCFWLPYILHPGIKAPLIFYAPAWVGVWIFFILSGYLIGKGFMSDKYKTNSIKDFIDFYIQRAIRILPIYFFIVFIDMFFVNTNMYFNGSETLRRVFTFTLRNPYGNCMIGNLWFVSTIVQLYLITPIIGKFILNPIKKLPNYKLCTSIAIFFLFIYGVLYRNILWINHADWEANIYSNILGNIDLFFCGFLFNVFTNSPKDTNKKKISRYISLMLFFIIFFVNFPIMRSIYYIDNYLQWVAKILYPSITLLSILFIIWAFDIKREASLATISNYNPIRWFEMLGTISFGIFICHGQTIYNLAQIFTFKDASIFYINISNLLANPIKITFSANAKMFCTTALWAFLFTIIWAVILHILFEKPLNKFRNNLKTHVAVERERERE